jgi:hypothetical protein
MLADAGADLREKQEQILRFAKDDKQKCKKQKQIPCGNDNETSTN